MTVFVVGSSDIMAYRKCLQLYHCRYFSFSHVSSRSNRSVDTGKLHSGFQLLNQLFVHVVAEQEEQVPGEGQRFCQGCWGQLSYLPANQNHQVCPSCPVTVGLEGRIQGYQLLSMTQQGIKQRYPKPQPRRVLLLPKCREARSPVGHAISSTA